MIRYNMYIQIGHLTNKELIRLTEKQLGKILKEMYDNAAEGYENTNILLFGIEFASVMLDRNYKSTDIVKASGLHPSYSIELRKGVKLSKYVTAN